jgi:cytochrome c oxidase assembly protein subunit 15
MTTAPIQLVRLRRMALIGLLLILAVTSLSAYMRLANAGLGCADWPACYGAALRASATSASLSDTSVAVARMLHRLAAMTVLVLALVIAAASFSSRPRLRREGVLAMVMIAIAIGLAVLGRYSAGAKLPIIAIGNVLGGFAMVATSFAVWRGPSAGTRWSMPAAGLMLLLVAQIALGVWVSASYSGLSCTGFPACGSVIDPSWSLLDPTRVPQIAATAPTHAEGAFTHMLHRVLALLVALAACATSVITWRDGRHRAALALAALLVLQIGLGVTLVLAALPFAAALLHNLVAALMLLAAMSCLRRERART